MVELTREARRGRAVGDVQELSFGDGEFDVVVAAWMLYHVPDIERALDEIVPRAAGRAAVSSLSRTAPTI